MARWPRSQPGWGAVASAGPQQVANTRSSHPSAEWSRASVGVHAGAVVESVREAGTRDTGLACDRVEDDATALSAGRWILHGIPTRLSLSLPVALPQALPEVYKRSDHLSRPGLGLGAFHAGVALPAGPTGRLTMACQLCSAGWTCLTRCRDGTSMNSGRASSRRALTARRVAPWPEWSAVPQN
jgi:hypothetical protein